MPELIEERPLPEGGDEIAPGVFAPAGTLRLQYARSAGPGGQNVNKLNTKAELWVHVASLRGLRPSAADRLRKLAGGRLTRRDELHLTSDTQRSQESNRQAVFDRLRELILQARVEPKVRRKTRPSKAAKRKRLEQKKRRGSIKANRRGASMDD